MTRLYLCGPMRGVPDLNFPAFDAAAKKLEHAGYTVFNPAAHDRQFREMAGREATIRECLEADTRWICDEAEGVAVLAGWDKSRGARAEVALAHAVDIPVNYVIYWTEIARVAA